ncbi:hypothetical protein CDAR_379001 [Caerostris darwini]|uniref:Uncharacterized protein n=1 Tax=Caerostris darwini TaxID=1538125 RepID=A0AAV4TY95_9ARAC|nr:hypothetical protein CDAR_379001 [Caerostris darwini]
MIMTGRQSLIPFFSYPHSRITGVPGFNHPSIPRPGFSILNHPLYDPTTASPVFLPRLSLPLFFPSPAFPGFLVKRNASLGSHPHHFDVSHPFLPAFSPPPHPLSGATRNFISAKDEKNGMRQVEVDDTVLTSRLLMSSTIITRKVE